jgi:hypothetical protein
MAKADSSKGPVLYCYKDDNLANGTGNCNIPAGAISDVSKFSANRASNPSEAAKQLGTSGDGGGCAQYFDYFKCPPEFPNLAHYQNKPEYSVYCYGKDKTSGKGCIIPQNANFSPEFKKGKSKIAIGTNKAVGHDCNDVFTRSSERTGCKGIYVIANRPYGKGKCYGNSGIGSKEQHQADCVQFGGVFKDDKNWECNFQFGPDPKPAALKAMVNRGDNAPFDPPGLLGECEGDCDNDNQCAEGLVCFSRDSSDQVPPGCKAGGEGDVSTHDYCVKPTKKLDQSAFHSVRQSIHQPFQIPLHFMKQKASYSAPFATTLAGALGEHPSVFA